jgi:chorismate--pyruvate lyase
MSDVVVSMIKSVQWYPMGQPALSVPVADWLMESGSITRRFEQHCTEVRIELKQECFIDYSQLVEDTCYFSSGQRYWLREVTLFGDKTPWLLGRTVIPEETLSGPEEALLVLGTVPLGRYLFNDNHTRLTRDFIQIGFQDACWARRSLLRLSGKPLLLTEVFLAESPLYQEGKPDFVK